MSKVGAVRSLFVLLGLAVAASCSDTPPVAPRAAVAPGHSRFAVHPAFQREPTGGPTITLGSIKGILIGPDGDSVVVTAQFTGDSAILVFDVALAGASQDYTLDLTAFDQQGVIAYHASEPITLKPGDNPAVPQPVLVYSAPDAALQALHVSPGGATLAANGFQTFGVSGTGPGGQTIASIRIAWSTNDATIATVDDNGNLQAGRFQGTTYVVARSVLGIADSALVQVHAPVDHVTVSPATITLARGSSAPDSAQLFDVGNHPIADRSATWSTSNAAVATVSAGGSITGVAIGSATITATAEGHTASTQVTVVSPIDHIAASPATLTFASLGDAQTITATLVPRTGANIAGITPTFSSSNTTIVTVDANGVVTSHGNGSATITIAADGFQTTVAVSMHQVATSLTVSPHGDAGNAIGETHRFTATAADARGNTVPAANITWTSSAPNVATVDQTGTATTTGSGTTTITAASGSKSDAATLTVTQIPAAIGVSADSASMAVGSSTALHAVLLDRLGNPIGATNPAWSTTTPSLISINGASARGLAGGTSNVTATVGIFTGSTTIQITGGTNVTSGPSTIEGLTIDASTNAPIVGATISATGASNATSFPDGSFIIGPVSNGTTITATASGYVATSFFNAQTAPTGAHIGGILMAPASTLSGSVTGEVLDATTFSGISGAAVSFRAGMNATTGSIITSTTTTTGGFYAVSLPAGTYTATVAASGFALGTATVVSLGGATQSNQNVSIVPNTGLRITLTWGAQPRDLDSHLFGPAADGSTFHTWFASRNGPNGQSLDHDVTSGFGPENTTVPSPLLPGTYAFFVQEFAGSGSMAASPASVTVTLNGTVLGTFHPPARSNEQPGDVWTVFTLDGATGTITPINTIVSGISGSVNGGGTNTEAIRRAVGPTKAGTVTKDIQQIIQGAAGKTKNP